MYKDWAKNQLSADYEPSVYDWHHMPLAEISERALAICKEAKELDLVRVAYALQSLEKAMTVINQRYPWRV